MEASLSKLAAALRERRAIIADEESRRDQAKHMARLAAVSSNLDQLESALSRSVDPRLVHFLQQRSYDKALDFIENTIRQSTAR